MVSPNEIWNLANGTSGTSEVRVSPGDVQSYTEFSPRCHGIRSTYGEFVSEHPEGTVS